MALSHALPDLLRDLWRHMSKRRQRQFSALLALMLVSAFAEVVSLGAVLPFLAVLTAPERMFNVPFVATAAKAWGISVPQQLLLPLTVTFASAALVAAGIRMLLMWANLRFGLASGASLSLELYRRTLYQPYQVHLARNSSEVISGITNKVNDVTFGVLQPLLALISALVLMASVIGILIFIDAIVAITAGLVFGLSYAVTAFLVRHRLKRNSQRIAREQTQMVKALQEGLGGIRDVLLDGAQPMYCEIYRRADMPLRQAQGNNQFINGMPRHVMEALGMVLIAVLAYILSGDKGGVAAALPTLGALALGAQRLLPALQLCYSSWAAIAASQASLAETIALLKQPLPPEASLPPAAPLRFAREIRFDGVRFRYSAEGPWVLDGLDLRIPKGARVGFVGSTGSGKSTALDLLMGLLPPTEGQLSVDGEPVIGARLRSWQRTIAHVPQSIYLADTTLAENIAFGVQPELIDLERVREAARQAQIAKFIESSPQGYDAFVGERGVRLSGGQRQRIGIARALYKQASVLIFDEATSALDNATEQSVMDSITSLDRSLTVFLIAHRLSTVRHCDLLVELNHGKIAGIGTYDELIHMSPGFRAMANAGAT
ncbi:ABC transporter ATP-binding protein [Polaromonas sp.]|jgi:ABC-type multidrug transport system fused ATPase/permease subunit|uniref:ABC transporter ATP-binding protein n=1 Tax=Polaromonas sp. TaxID=1869339 RepID=UPI0037C7CF24